jgi:UDP-glucose 4-epimerase
VVTRTLIIGGGGYIGMHLIPLLLTSGRHVTVIDSKEAPPVHFPPEATFISGDFGRLDQICPLLDRHEEVIHLAYATVPNTSFGHPLEDLLQNLPTSVQLFSEVAARGGLLILVSSGGTVYGESIEIPITENHPTNPISPYGVTKLTLEKYAHLFSRTHGLKVICLRPANAFGVGQMPFIGQGFVSTALASALIKKPVKIFGQRGAVRDYIYVSDIATGIFHVLERGQLSEIYNVGSGEGFSNMDVVEACSPMLSVIGCNIAVEHIPERVFDVKTNILCSRKLKAQTGWMPKMVPL